MFYKENIKIIPCNLENHLTLLALAVFFLNSSLNLGKKARLAYLFPVDIQDLYYLCKILKNKYNLDTIIVSEGKVKYLEITSKIVFSKLMEPLAIPALNHKLKSKQFKLGLFSD
jgi:hypothetical protein